MTEPAPSTAKEITARLRRAFRYRGLLVLALWQAPVQPVIRPNGSLGFVLLGGNDELAMFSCDGEAPETQQVSYGGAAIEADQDLGAKARMVAVAGYADSDWGSHRGGFGAAQVRGDWGGFGIGLGLAVLPGLDETNSEPWVLPSGYLRVGSAGKLHLRADFLPPNALGMQQIGRLGVGWNAVDRVRPAAFVGLAGLGYGSDATGIAADLTIPTGSRFALRAQGHLGSGEEHTVAGIAIGGSILFGRAVTADGTARPAPAPVERPPLPGATRTDRRSVPGRALPH